MSDANKPVDALLVDQPVAAQPVTAQPVASQRPGSLVAICVIAIALGGLGTLVAGWGLVATLFVEQLQAGTSFGPGAMGPGASQEAADLMLEMQEKINGLTLQFRWMNFSLSAAHLPVALLLLIGAIRTLMLKPQGRMLLLSASCLAIVFEFCRAIVQLQVQLQMSSIMNNYMTAMMEAAAAEAGGGGPPPDVFAKIMQYSMIGGLIFGLAFVLAKIIFYVITVTYLGNPKVKALFVQNDGK